MWAALIPIVLEAGMRLVSYLLQQKQLSKEAAERFFEFCRKAGEDMGSVKLKELGDTQLDWLKNTPWEGKV